GNLTTRDCMVAELPAAGKLPASPMGAESSLQAETNPDSKLVGPMLVPGEKTVQSPVVEQTPVARPPLTMPAAEKATVPAGLPAAVSSVPWLGTPPGAPVPQGPPIQSSGAAKTAPAAPTVQQTSHSAPGTG